jgi:hypothetical protein
MSGSLRQRIEQAVEPLLKRGFCVQRLAEHAWSFGNPLRTLGDRGPAFVDVTEHGTGAVVRPRE